jgi:hypothetical protein
MHSVECLGRGKVRFVLEGMVVVVRRWCDEMKI